MEVDRRSVLHRTADQYAEVDLLVLPCLALQSFLRSPCLSLSRLTNPFTLPKAASVHGLRYIFEERLPSSDRILWTAAVLLGLLLSGTMVVQVGVKCKTKPLRHICIHQV